MKMIISQGLSIGKVACIMRFVFFNTRFQLFLSRSVTLKATRIKKIIILDTMSSFA